MGNYLFLYHGGGGAPSTPEEGQKVLKAWTDWFTTLGDKVVDAGNPTSTSKTIQPGGSTSANGSAVTGYSVIKADSFDAAVAAAKGSPQLTSGGTIEVVQVDELM
jgi:hypothetical protein